MIALWTAPQGGAWTRLPGPVTAWSILRTDRLGKDSFRVELADAALPDGRLRFSARVDGVGWFTGLADEVLRTESGAGRRLVLRGRGLVVLRLGGNAELPKLFIHLAHIALDALFDIAVVMVVHLLALGRLRAKKRAPAEAQILPAVEKCAVDEKILLLRADIGDNALRPLVSQKAQNTDRLLRQGLHRAQKRRFLIERLAGERAECRGDVEGIVLDTDIQ